jgi:hypothetical protein
LNHVGAADLSDLARNAFRVRPEAGSGGENPAPRFAGRKVDQKFIPAKPDSPDLCLLPFAM